MKNILLKNTDFIELPATLPSGEVITYSKGARQQVNWGTSGKTTQVNGNRLVLKKDLRNFSDTFTYTSGPMVESGSGRVQIKTDTVGVTTKTRVNGSPVVMIEPAGFKVEIVKQSPAKDSKPQPPLVDTNSIGAPIAAQAAFSANKPSKVKGTD